jgi:hypothetical protein
MKSTYIFFGVIAILLFNLAVIQRDKQLLESYDKVCAELPQPHPNCRYAK